MHRNYIVDLKNSIKFYLNMSLKCLFGMIVLFGVIIFASKHERDYQLEQQRLALAIEPLFASKADLSNLEQEKYSTQSLLKGYDFISTVCSDAYNVNLKLSEEVFYNENIISTQSRIIEHIKILNKNCNIVIKDIIKLKSYENLDLNYFKQRNKVKDILSILEHINYNFEEIVDIINKLSQERRYKAYYILNFIQYLILLNLLLTIFLIIIDRKDEENLEDFYINKFKLSSSIATTPLFFYLIFENYFKISLLFPLLFTVFFLQSLWYISRYSRSI